MSINIIFIFKSVPSIHMVIQAMWRFLTSQKISPKYTQLPVFSKNCSLEHGFLCLQQIGSKSEQRGTGIFFWLLLNFLHQWLVRDILVKHAPTQIGQNLFSQDSQMFPWVMMRKFWRITLYLNRELLSMAYSLEEKNKIRRWLLNNFMLHWLEREVVLDDWYNAKGLYVLVYM